MIDKDFFDHLEEQIHQTVQDALNLKETVVHTVRENVNVQKGPVPPTKSVPQKRYAYPVRPVRVMKDQIRIRKAPSGSVAGIIMEIIGLVGAISTGLAFILLALISVLFGMPWTAFAISSFVIVPLCVGFSALAFCGVRQVRRKRRFQ